MDSAITTSQRPSLTGQSGAGCPKVLIVASTLHVGGAERVIASLAKTLDRRKFDVTVCYLKENGVVGDELLRAGVNLIPLPGRVYGKRDRLTFLKLRRLIQDGGFSIVHTHDMHGFLDASACRLTTSGFRHVHTFHFGNYPHRERLYRRLENLLWRIPDRLVAVSRAQADSIRSLYRIPNSRMSVVWNGVETPRPSVSPDVRAACEGAIGPIIASISTLIPQKGLHLLIDAAAELRDRGLGFRLLIVGGGPLEAELKAQAQCLKLGPDLLRFIGWVPEASDRALPACDIFVQSSLWEAMSIVVLEAMASGKPMVVTNVGENPYIVEHGATGLLVEHSDARAISRALEALISDHALRNRLGKAARERHSERFTLSQMTNDYASLYSEMLRELPN